MKTRKCREKSTGAEGVAKWEMGGIEQGLPT